MGNLFGTDGIRGTVGTAPFTSEDTVRLGTAIGTWITQNYGTHASLLIAHDTRQSSEWLTNSLCAGLLLSPLTAHLAGILPTPAVSHILAHTDQFACGMIISASHNPFIDNGIKLIDRTTGKLTKEHEEIITHYFHQGHPITYDTFGATKTCADAAPSYISALSTFFSSLSLDGRTIVLDCAHGATYAVAPTIFSALGAHVIPIHTQPNGTNINDQCGALDTRSLQQAVIEHNADFGCAFDGDGDRVIMVNRNGQLKNGDDLLALLTTHPHYANQNIVVGTVMTNHGLEQYLHKKNKLLLRTPVGDRWVAERLTENALLLGGEQSGHIILRDYLPTGDGIATALRVIEAVLHTHNWNMDTFDAYPQKMINIPVAHKKDLKEPSIAAIIADYRKQLDAGRLYVRYSGTENLLRVMVEDRENDVAHRICHHLAQALAKELQ